MGPSLHGWVVWRLPRVGVLRADVLGGGLARLGRRRGGGGPLAELERGVRVGAGRDADSGGGKTVAFALKNPDTSVFFDKELWTVAELLERDDSGVDAIAGHWSKTDPKRVEALLGKLLVYC